MEPTTQRKLVGYVYESIDAKAKGKPPIDSFEVEQHTAVVARKVGGEWRFYSHWSDGYIPAIGQVIHE